MYLFVVALHVVLCVFLVLIIILQPGKGGDVGAAFGGAGGSTMFGPQGPTNLLQRATTAVAVMFMGTSLTLAIFSNKAMLNDSNVDDELERIAAEQPVAVPAPAPEGAGTDGAAPLDAGVEGAAPVETTPEGADAAAPQVENP